MKVSRKYGMVGEGIEGKGELVACKERPMMVSINEKEEEEAEENKGSGRSQEEEKPLVCIYMISVRVYKQRKSDASFM